MANRSHNYKRVLEEIVHVNSWYCKREDDGRFLNLHIDVSFDTNYLGTDVDAPVRFKLGVRRANVEATVVSQNYKIDPMTISRKYFSGFTNVLRETNFSMDGSLHAKASTGIDMNGVSLDIGAKSEAKSDFSTKRISVQEMKIEDLHVKDFAIANGHAWTITAVAQPILEDRPWNPIERLLSMKQSGSNGGGDPSIIVSIKCRREDLVISDIQTKDQGIGGKIKSKIFSDINLKVAEAYIRTKLTEFGLLSTGSIDDPYVMITIAEVVPQPEVY